MSETEEALKHVNEAMAKLEAKSSSVWMRYEPWFCLIAGMVIGGLAVHFV